MVNLFLQSSFFQSKLSGCRGGRGFLHGYNITSIDFLVISTYAWYVIVECWVMANTNTGISITYKVPEDSMMIKLNNLSAHKLGLSHIGFTKKMSLSSAKEAYGFIIAVLPATDHWCLETPCPTIQQCTSELHSEHLTHQTFTHWHFYQFSRLI